MSKLIKNTKRPSKSVFNFIREWFAIRSYVDSIGEHKRDIIITKVNQACQSLNDAKGAFEGAIKHFDDISFTKTTEIVNEYYNLSSHYQNCQTKSDAINRDMHEIKRASRALFVEWNYELSTYSNKSLRDSSKQQMLLAKNSYTKMLKEIEKTDDIIWPILTSFHDQTLYLKHNINARFISALKSDFMSIGIDISMLTQSIESTISEANQLMGILNGQGEA